jgi:uncharacterized membrane protein YoaK (UPF0700 family)
VVSGVFQQFWLFVQAHAPWHFFVCGAVMATASAYSACVADKIPVGLKVRMIWMFCLGIVLVLGSSVYIIADAIRSGLAH